MKIDDNYNLVRKSTAQMADELKRIISDSKYLIFDFSFFMYINSGRFYSWIFDIIANSDIKILVSDEFFKCYDIVYKSTSEEQRETALTVSNFIKSQTNRTFFDSKFDSTEKLLKKFSTCKETVVFFAKNSEAEEILRNIDQVSAELVFCFSNGKLAFNGANEFFKKYRQPPALINEDSLVRIPDYPSTGSVLHTIDNQEYILRELISSGAEGTVYSTNDSNYVCKIYHESNYTLSVMRKLKLLEERNVRYEGICWPEKRVFTEKGCPIGFIMKKANGKTFSSVFNGQLSVEEFLPEICPEKLFEISLETLRKIKYLHLKGIIVGDIRLQNILIDKDYNITLIDLDSCQINEYPSGFGDEDFTPGENQFKEFSSFLRTYYNESFSCAVLTFMILFYGLHPYSQKFGADTIAEEILALSFKFPEKTDGDYSLIPDGGYDVVWKRLPVEIRAMFYDCFKNNKRPSVYSLIKALEKYVDVGESESENNSILDSNEISTDDDLMTEPNLSYEINIKRTEPKENGIKKKKTLFTILFWTFIVIVSAAFIGFLVIYVKYAVSHGYTINYLPYAWLPIEELLEKYSIVN